MHCLYKKVYFSKMEGVKIRNKEFDSPEVNLFLHCHCMGLSFFVPDLFRNGKHFQNHSTYCETKNPVSFKLSEKDVCLNTIFYF